MMKHRSAGLFATLAVAVVSSSCGLADGGDRNIDGSVDSDTRITLERGGCYGSCPIYSLSIAGDGTVSYFGEMYVNVKGPASKQVPVSDVQALVDQMLDAEYFELSVPDDCPAGVSTDAASATTSLTLDGETHTVDHYYGNRCAPAGLRALEDAIDTLADSGTWIRCDTSTSTCCEPGGNPYLPPCSR
jgi:hypothetical protein